MQGTNVSRALVLGAGKSGAAAVRLLRRLGVEPSVYDDNTPWEKKGKEAAGLGLEGARLFGPGQLPSIEAFGQVIVSPGIPMSHPALKEAAAARIPVIGELELAFRNQRLPLAAVTGSNGKSTVTELASHILSGLGCRSVAAGNIGRPFSEVALELIDDREAYGCAVLEVSSFQLETVAGFRPDAAAFLNVTPDHLDRHRDMGEYFRTKCRIFENQRPEDTAVINEDVTPLMHKNFRAARFGFSLRHRPDNGAWVERKGGKELIRVASGGKVLGEMPWEAYSLKGTHNQYNLMAAVGLAVAMGRKPQEALEAARGFAAPDHRLQLVGSWNGVDWYDDSKGTNSGAVATALECFREGSVVLILGGRDKDMDFRPLKDPIRRKARHLILIGEAKDRLKSCLRGTCSMSSASSMEEAVSVAIMKARPGNTVLLSPACASFDMFSGYKERGEVFQREAIRQNGPAGGGARDGSGARGDSGGGGPRWSMESADSAQFGEEDLADGDGPDEGPLEVRAAGVKVPPRMAPKARRSTGYLA